MVVYQLPYVATVTGIGQLSVKNWKVGLMNRIVQLGTPVHTHMCTHPMLHIVHHTCTHSTCMHISVVLVNYNYN